jgi:hypothetical protein
MLVYEFKYTRYGINDNIKDENLEYLLGEMVNHFYYSYSCCQRVLDHNNKIIYVLFEDEAKKFEPDLGYEVRILDF